MKNSQRLRRHVPVCGCGTALGISRSADFGDGRRCLFRLLRCGLLLRERAEGLRDALQRWHRAFDGR